jgi:fatty acid desaturase
MGVTNPALAAWLLPLALYLAYCAGALTHNHNHCPVFRSRSCNIAYGAWLSVFYGLPIFTWIPTHNQNHHRYLDSAEDATHTWRYSRRNTLLNALVYPLRSSRWHLPLLAKFLRKAARSPRRMRMIVLQCAALPAAHLVGCTAAVQLHGLRVGGVAYALAMGLPALLAPYLMMATNYLQHVNCDPKSPDNHSRNFVSPWVNWFVFDAGYHTVHHEHPGEHWSRYAELHRARRDRIHPSLNQHSIVSFCVWTYAVGLFLARYRTEDLSLRSLEASP